MSHVVSTLGVSERRACKALAMPRSTYRFRPKRPDRDRLLVRRLHQLSEAHPRYGYRRITALLRNEGWRVNRKRVQRLWRLHGLKVPPKTRRRTRLGNGGAGLRLASRRGAARVCARSDFVLDSGRPRRPVEAADGRGRAQPLRAQLKDSWSASPVTS